MDKGEMKVTKQGTVRMTISKCVLHLQM